MRHVGKRLNKSCPFQLRGADVSKAYLKVEFVRSEDFYKQMIDLTPSLCRHLDSLLDEIKSPDNVDEVY